MTRRSFDIVISGAGPVGLTAALATRITLGKRARILVCDPNLNFPRRLLIAYAIAAAPQRLLENIGAWDRVRDVQPVMRMVISDSAQRDIVRHPFLTFETGAIPGEPLAHIIGHNHLVDTLMDAAQDADISFRGDSIAAMAQIGHSIEIVLRGGEVLTASLLAACDGAQSTVRELAKIPATGWDYGRSAIVATIEAEHDHDGTAVQHFLPAGTFALLPMSHRRFSIVWVEKPDQVKRLCQGSRENFERELQQRAGHEFGALTLIEGPQHFPLRLQIARRLHAPRLALLGDAAHTTHPLAGQGLNLGLRDVGFLTHHLSQNARLGLDIGAGDLLDAYDRSRRFETVATLAAADALFKLFDLPGPSVRMLRDVGLGLVDRSTRLKSMFVREAAGGSRNTPELLRQKA